MAWCADSLPHSGLFDHLSDKYHNEGLYTAAQEEIMDHNGRVKEIVPSEKLLGVSLCATVGTRLIEYLGV